MDMTEIGLVNAAHEGLRADLASTARLGAPAAVLVTG